mgnify:CR=1 FL=1
MDTSAVSTISDSSAGPAYYLVRDWTQERGNRFEAVRTEKTVMWLILSLIIAVVAFNIISMLVMVVTHKQPDLAILKTMGTRDGTIMRIFMIQGSVIGVVGTALGVVGGILLALTTTIVGGIGGYLMRLGKTLLVGASLPARYRWRGAPRCGALRRGPAAPRRPPGWRAPAALRRWPGMF